MLAALLFLLTCAAIAAIWNRWFTPLPRRIAVTFVLLTSVYCAPTLFTNRVDVPARLANVAYPWKATGVAPVNANTGIVFTQLVPWTRNAREQLLHGELPLWNRNSAAGAPLLANQQTAIFHPFTLLGLLVPIGKAFTLSAALRIFAVLLFTFVFLRRWTQNDAAAVFGAIAYAFCTFHMVWLLFPLGLASMMLPAVLTGIQELVATRTRAAYVLLTIALACTVLGGHPESALWVWLTAVAYTFYCARTDWRAIAWSASAFVVAMLLTAFFWLPTLTVLQSSGRFEAVQSAEANPANHGLSYEWLLTFIAPNVLGNPVRADYVPPRGSHPAVLNDYGEVASSYAGLIPLALALASPLVVRRRPIGFAWFLMLFALLAVAEAPLWRDGLRAIPLAGISIQQRLRILWDLGVCIAAALTVTELSRKSAILCCSGAIAAFIAVHTLRPLAIEPLAIAQFAIPIAVAFTMIFVRGRIWIASALVIVDLWSATYRYNPSARPEELYPVTGAIRYLQEHARGANRMAAWGWSFLPETPGYYGLEDVKATDPIHNARYLRLLHGYLNVESGSYDLVLRNYKQPFFDYLNIRYLYVPPEHELSDPKFVLRYKGKDGAVLENRSVLPRYFLVRNARIEPDFGLTVWYSREIRNFGIDAMVDHVPRQVQRAAPHLPTTGNLAFAGGEVRLLDYQPARALLEVESRGWNLLVTSDASWRGWRAYWNGSRQPPVIVNGAFLGVFVPPGRGKLLLRYAPDELRTGWQAAAAGMLLLGAMLVILRRPTAARDTIRR
ncbi:MAG: YfhO family protein [Acidobacteriota bacterium]|nr:YfhO family protein [Acidobacteriota bacterium]